MKIIAGASLLCLFALNSSAQKLQSGADSLSYALGQDIARSIKSIGVPINATIVSESLTKALQGEEGLFGEQEVQQIIRQQLMAAQEAKAAVFKEKSNRFFEDNKKNDGVVVDSSGIQYLVLQPGTGEQPTKEDEVTVHYIGKLIDGSTFDNSYDRGEPITFGLDGVIPGWQIALPLMKKGAKYRFFIPYDLAYGERGSGAIPPFSTLIFDIELLNITPKES
ncbi:FKBP-type peptidyl-prolyl cis-trans isomerase [Sphingobacterium sp. lm-10]|uniref:FKBP-type peptidyl-prolyl cis-trans isomerase n=1 Tax=Sphingobacterium sp. lm-10 TaxID=2944904 RepID=UPI00202069DF|nr:FKBP-type peptidyl-prolyl cis-trans isomerase [Sphingobacterium sp. lm-10]MCL7986976.1 FKBP-type peptidyl-prolyl cis-trans isomerase [Sphingobacterium sp. lm-10]